MAVILKNNGEDNRFFVHRIVAEVFIEHDEQLNEVNHKDENKQNNNVKNLEWVTHKENMNYGTRTERQARTARGRKRSPLTDETKIKISDKLKGSNHPKAKKVVCVENGMIFETVKEANEWCSITAGVGECCKGKQKTAGGFHWKYID